MVLSSVPPAPADPLTVFRAAKPGLRRRSANQRRGVSSFSIYDHFRPSLVLQGSWALATAGLGVLCATLIRWSATTTTIPSPGRHFLLTQRHARFSLGLAVFAVGAHTLYRVLNRVFTDHAQRTVVAALTHLAQTGQRLDRCCVRMIKAVQEVELVARGYRLTTPLPPISRIENQSPAKHCGRLRRCLANVLAAQFKVWHIPEPDLGLMDADDDTVEAEGREITAEGTPYGDSETMLALQDLKRCLTDVHLLRQDWLQRFVVTYAEGDLDTCREALAALRTPTEVTQDCLQCVTDNFDPETDFESPELPASGSPTKPPPAQQAFLSQLSGLAHILRGVQAKLYLCTQSLEEDSDNLAAVKAYHDSLRMDIQHLEAQWEASARALETIVSPPSQGNPEMTTTNSTRDANDDETTSAESVEPGEVFRHDCDPVIDAESDGVERVFEALAEQTSVAPRPSVVPREERIRIQREKRSVEAERRAAQMAKVSFVSELQGVLNRKKGPIDQP